MNGILENTPVSETYEDVEALATHVAGIFLRKHGGDYDECVSISHVVFMDSYRNWKPGKAPFSSYFSSNLYRRLLENKRREGRIGVVFSINAPQPCSGNEIDVEDRNSCSFDLEEFQEKLPEDARKIVSLIFETPEEVQRAIDKKGGQPRNIRSTIREHLTSLGWSVARIGEAFEEIAACLI